ncbi:MAG: hypothetical protein R2729_02945 [Bryobacteraceae bacterium]
MAVVTFSGEPGCRAADAARFLASRRGFDYLSESGLRQALAAEYSAETAIPDRLFREAVSPILARRAAKSHVVLECAAAESIAEGFPALFRIHLGGPVRFRTGAFMVDHGLARTQAATLLAQLEREEGALRKRRFGRTRPAPGEVDMVLNAAAVEPEQIAAIASDAIDRMGLLDFGLLPAVREAEIEFQARMALARRGIAPAGIPAAERKPFANESEQMFASLLDFYRIAWEYEPRSFPIRWESNGKVAESFTPDFFLPEFNLYVELTTMKQAHVTKKNRKVKLLRSLHPHIHIQVFYQKDFHNLIFKYGLPASAAGTALAT